MSGCSAALRSLTSSLTTAVAEGRLNEVTTEVGQVNANGGQCRKIWGFDGNLSNTLFTKIMQCRLELGQMVSISKYRGTTRYRCRNFKVSNYRLMTGWFILNVIP